MSAGGRPPRKGGGKRGGGAGGKGSGKRPGAGKRPGDGRGGRPDGGRRGPGGPQRGGHEREPERRERPAGDPRQVLYGRNPVFEALRSDRRRVHHVWATEPTISTESWLREADVPVDVADADWLDRKAQTAHHQGICALADPYPYADPAGLLAGPTPLVVALDEVQDPQNVGAIARTAECAGASGLVLPERRSADVTPTVGKASAGAIEHLPIARVRNLADWLAEAKRARAWVYGAAATPGAVPWTEVDWTGPVVVVMGAEGRGLRPRVASSCDALVALPMRGRIGSLNVSAAASALLYEAVRARR